ncbi:endoplasmic reticulum oxidoreductin 1, partial [Basidiobolus meristosporus CBS 931.73]
HIESSYVNLIQNPERFTGYSGEGANRIWQLIYAEGCSQGKNQLKPVSRIQNTLTQMNCEDHDTFLENPVYYKLISGLHTSISIHICLDHYNTETSQWGRDMHCYQDRVGNFPSRIENLYFVYMLLLEALSKGLPLLSSSDTFMNNLQAEKDAKTLVSKALFSMASEPHIVDTKALLHEASSFVGTKALQGHLHNVLRIIECVTCDRCRLWGTLQVTGLSVALKILDSSEKSRLEIIRTTERHLQHSEIVALFNTLNRLSESVEAVAAFAKPESIAAR